MQLFEANSGEGHRHVQSAVQSEGQHPPSSSDSRPSRTGLRPCSTANSTEIKDRGPVCWDGSQSSVFLRSIISIESLLATRNGGLAGHRKEEVRWGPRSQTPLQRLQAELASSELLFGERCSRGGGWHPSYRSCICPACHPSCTYYKYHVLTCMQLTLL
jgi:hypothetical protein